MGLRLELLPKLCFLRALRSAKSLSFLTVHAPPLEPTGKEARCPETTSEQKHRSEGQGRNGLTLTLRLREKPWMPATQVSGGFASQSLPCLTLFSMPGESTKSPVKRVSLLSWLPLCLCLPTADHHLLPSPYLFLWCGVAVCSGKGSCSQ